MQNVHLCVVSNDIDFYRLGGNKFGSVEVAAALSKSLVSMPSLRELGYVVLYIYRSMFCSSTSRFNLNAIQQKNV